MMASTRRRDPQSDGPWIFDAHPARLRLALACSEPLDASELAAASQQKDANARTSADKLVDYGVLETVAARDGRNSYLLSDSWRVAVADARRKASKGRVDPGQLLLLVSRETSPAFYRHVADRDGIDRRMTWATRLPGNSRYGLIVALDEDLDEDAAERFLGELREAGVDCETLKTGRLAGFRELRELAAASLPGAIGKEG